MSSWIVGAFLTGSDINEHPLDEQTYQTSYFELSQEIAKKGGSMVVVRGQASYQGNGVFSHAWKMIAPNVFTELSETKVDVIFNKGKFQNDGTVPQFNNKQLAEICSDKQKTYEYFSEYSPQTWYVDTKEKYHSVLSGLTDKMVVCKPPDGYEGIGVKIGKADELVQQEPSLPLLVQTFLDTSAGIPGIVDGYHDLRVAVFDGEILYSYVRTPPPGKLTANVAQGGTFFMLELERIPQSVIEIVREIDKKVAFVGPRFYSVDFAVTPDGPKIIEMNSSLGLLPNADAPVFRTLKEKLAATFEQLSA